MAGYRYLVIYREANRHVVRYLSGRVQGRYSWGPGFESRSTSIFYKHLLHLAPDVGQPTL